VATKGGHRRGQRHVTIFTNSWLLLQVPYGILGVSMLTAIMPRLSEAAAKGDLGGVVDNLSVGSRMSAVMLIPLCAMITVLGPQVGVALFAIRHSEASKRHVTGPQPHHIRVRAGLLRDRHAPDAGVLRDEDARTPTVIVAAMVVIRSRCSTPARAC